ncbi:MAG: hypothetical protein D6812_13495 [Deltaproteobacteria bacterium]|nr:MAG: hypothetical protein D6812_13495 [Deltaproteobacteria bacterium]
MKEVRSTWLKSDRLISAMLPYGSTQEKSQAAYLADPERFRNKIPQPPRLREEVWIHPPQDGLLADSRERSWAGGRKRLFPSGCGREDARARE